MDMGSIIALLIVLALFALVIVRLWIRHKRGGGCIDCKDEACVFHGTDHEPEPGEILPDGTVAHCPAVDRAFEAVDEELGKVPGEQGVTSASAAAASNPGSAKRANPGA